MSDPSDSPSYKNATELDHMLIADKDNYLNPQHETVPASGKCKSSIINTFRND